MQSLSFPSLPLVVFGALCSAGCPNQELAPLTPCTVSGVSIDAAQSGVDQVDLLFVIDNSGSMAQEQVKLRQQIRQLVEVLTSGDLDGIPNPGGKPDFTPVSSLHLGVVSVDLGVNGRPDIPGCRDAGDEGRLLSSTAVALSGVKDTSDMQVTLVPARPECGNVTVPRFISFESKTSSVLETAHQFSCVSQLGVLGCGYEQQLESMWRALAPSTDTSFSRGARGQGAPMGQNTGFLRDEAVLAVIMVTDEEDCSSPDQNAAALYSVADTSIANVLCARNAHKLHDVQRYVTGLRSLKRAAYQDRIVFAGIVGIPKADRTAGLSLDQILTLPEMQVAEDTTSVRGQPTQVPRPACRANGGAGDAAPARRMVEVARAFGSNGVVTSICEDDYGPALNAILAKIAAKLKGQCLPRKLNRNAENKVECTVVEIKSATDRTPCDPSKGRIRQLKDRTVEGVSRVVCEVEQLAVPGPTAPDGAGWYYDDFSKDALECMDNKQQIAFTSAAPLATGASARFECFQSVTRVASDALGVEAVNTPCAADGSDEASGDARCAALSLPEQPLLCVQGTCQLGCSSAAGCQAGHVCTADVNGRGYCTNPTCPTSEG